MWNLPLLFKRTLHIDMAWYGGKHPYLEVGCYNWNIGSYSLLLRIKQTLHSNNIAKIWVWTPMFSFSVKRKNMKSIIKWGESVAI